MFACLLSRATRALHDLQVTRLGMEVGGLSSETPYETGQPLVEVSEDVVCGGYGVRYKTTLASEGNWPALDGASIDTTKTIGIRICKLGNPQKLYYYAFKLDHMLYVTARGEENPAIQKDDEWYVEHGERNCVVFKSTRALVSKGSQDSFRFYRNTLYPETYSGLTLAQICNVVYDNTFHETVRRSRGVFESKKTLWPDTETSSNTRCSIQVSEYGAGSDYVYSFDRNGEQYATGTVEKMQNLDAWTIESATKTSVVFKVSGSQHVEFRLKRWSGRGYSDGSQPRITFRYSPQLETGPPLFDTPGRTPAVFHVTYDNGYIAEVKQPNGAWADRAVGWPSWMPSKRGKPLDVARYGDSKFVYSVTVDGFQYVTTRQDASMFFDGMKLEIVCANDDYVIFKESGGNDISCVFYRNAILPGTFASERPSAEYEVTYDPRYYRYLFSSFAVPGYSGAPTTCYWPKQLAASPDLRPKFRVREYENSGEYTYCVDRNGDEYTTHSGPKINIRTGVLWTIESAAPGRVVFREDPNRFSIQTGEKESSAFKSITFYLNRWSGNGYDAGTAPERFDVVGDDPPSKRQRA